jgi:hypothetical protein
VRLLHPHTGQLLREHRWQARGQHRIADADRPPRTPVETVQLLGRAARSGHATGTLCTTIHQQDGAPGVRRILGVLSLAKHHGVPAGGLPTLRQIDPLIRQLTLYRDLIDCHLDKEPSA